MLALYRKYRPTKLEDVVGQEQVTASLKNALEEQKIGHAYLFIGPRGTGKTSVARIFAHAVNGFDYQLEDSYLDIVEIDAASNTGVDNIRELREKAIIAPSSGKYKVYIIDEVHMLSKSAANALLKTLEEPPAHVIFIMATTEANKVPITISSRTQLYNFRLADAEVMTAHLRKIADAEKIKIDDDALRILVRRGGGSFRDSLSLLDQIATLKKGEITAAVLEDALGLPSEQAVNDLLNAHRAGDAAEIEQSLSNLLSAGLSPETVAAEMIARIVAAPDPAGLKLLERLPRVQPPFPEAKLLLALLTDLAPSSTSSTSPTSSVSTAAPSKPKTSAKASLVAPPPAVVAEAVISESAQSEQSAQPEQSTQEEQPAPSASSTEDASASAVEASNSANPADFSWETYLEQVRAVSNAVYLQLQKCDHQLEDATLHLYPEQKFTHKILSDPAHTEKLISCLGGLGLKIHNIHDRITPKDDTLNKISDIMGDVREIKGDMPF